MSQPSAINVNTELLQLITPSQAWEYEILPLELSGDKLILAISEYKNTPDSEAELEILLGKELGFIPNDKRFVINALKKFYPSQEEESGISYDKNFLDKVIQEARQNECSDIHFEIYEDECRVRIRVDGKLVEKYMLPLKEYKTIVNKIKIKANLNIAEKRLPQDGRILYNNNNLEFDIRVSILPTLNGEKVVLRLLQKEAAHLSLDALGMSSHQLSKYREGISKSHGIVLISGPTGSGKTTTLYGTLKEINNTESNILTIEDPIEYTLKGINQVQLKEDIGLTFSRALRTFLRQDPDIIMLGEIRDPETAQIAIRSALTGHLVFSTIHTNSAFGIISRLSDMGIPPYLIASTLSLAVAQRLVRLLCPDCKIETVFDSGKLPQQFRDRKLQGKVYEAVGCELCNHSGYSGRKAIYEVISIDDTISELIRTEKITLKYLIENHRINTLQDSALSLYSSGQTALSEIYPVLISNMN